MWWHNLKISLRGISRDRGYSLFNILGLAVALACGFLFVFWIKFELSYEHSYTKADRTYRLMNMEERVTGAHYVLQIPYSIQGLKEQFPQIEQVTSIGIYDNKVRKWGDDASQEYDSKVAFSNPDFLRVFSYEYVEGTPANVVRNHGIIISEEFARRLFGKEPALGQLIQAGGGNPQVVDAVVKVPKNTELQFDLLMPTSIGINGITFILLREGERMTPELRDMLAEFGMNAPKNWDRTRAADDSKLVAQSILETHLHAPADLVLNINQRYEGGGDLGQLYLFAVVALLTIIIAIINYVNTSIARAMSRMKEVGVRKVTGALRGELIGRFLFESFLITLLGVILSMVLVKALFPYFSEAMGNTISLVIDGQTIGIAAVMCVVVTVLSGGYAAFYLSSLPPSVVFRGGRTAGSKERLRKVLLGVQFFLAVGILICTSIIYKQVDAILNSKEGMNRENVFSFRTQLWNTQTFIDVILAENPDIISATAAHSPPYKITREFTGGFGWEGNPPDVEDLSFLTAYSDEHYIDVWGLEMVEGKFLSRLRNDMTSTERAIEIGYIETVINQTMQKLMGVDNPIGMEIRYTQNDWAPRKIVGVVKDFNFKPLTQPIQPLMMVYEPEAMFIMYVKTNGRNNTETMRWVIDKHNEMRPGPTPLTAWQSAEDEYRDLHQTELRTRTNMAILSAIALFLSLLGVVSMVSFMLEKRTKDIAIRKINGATEWNIITLFGREILTSCIVASVLVIPLCYYIMSRWLETFVFRTQPSWWIFVLVPVAVMLVTFAIIAVQVWNVARCNPVESLTSE